MVIRSYQLYQLLTKKEMSLKDWLTLIHPAIAIILVYPLLGIAVNFAWQTRQRRLQTTAGKSKIPPVVGREHLQIGKWLSGIVVLVTLLGLAYPLIYKNILEKQLFRNQPGQFIFILLMFAATIASLVLLYRGRQKTWRGIFATLTGMGLVVLGSQEGVWRLTSHWYWSHFYYGITASMLMIFSLATVEDIYRDKSNRWRYLHTILNCFAVLLFLGQGITGVRDLFEIGLWTQPPA
ncbi:MAG: DUF4079 domain-containing protein [Oscillatoria sp. PMC 1051.18]|nr:DUF4079 domain-containing protein [Oscillatoria sp. PMC 1051.18]